MYEQEGIVRTVGVKIGARGTGWKCKEMTVGVQRLALVTPAEKVDEELAVHASPVNVNNDVVEKGGEVNEEVMEVEEEEHVTSREIKNLEVPAWMRPVSASRSSCMSIVNHSALQGLNMELWME